MGRDFSSTNWKHTRKLLDSPMYCCRTWYQVVHNSTYVRRTTKIPALGHVQPITTAVLCDRHTALLLPQFLSPVYPPCVTLKSTLSASTLSLHPTRYTVLVVVSVRLAALRPFFQPSLRSPLAGLLPLFLVYSHWIETCPPVHQQQLLCACASHTNKTLGTRHYFWLVTTPSSRAAERQPSQTRG